MSNREVAKTNTTKIYIFSHFKMGIEKLKNPKRAAVIGIILLIAFIYFHTHSFTKTLGLGVPSWMTMLNLLMVAEVFIGLMIVTGIPLASFRIEQKLQEIGLVNSLGVTPYLKEIKKTPKYKDLIFCGNGVPLNVWEDSLFDIEHGLDCHAVFVRYQNGKKDIVLRCVPASSPFENRDLINLETTPKEPTKYTLGRSADGEEVIVDLGKTPHALIAGATGSGKTILLNNMLFQSVIKRNRDKNYDSQIIIADFKGGVDYQGFWDQEAILCFDEESFNHELFRAVNILDDRKNYFNVAHVRNIHEYNARTKGKPMPTILVACDEIVEVLDKTGADARRKELIKQIEAKLSTIARQGRAFGVHLILGTQRPDSDVLNGQIKNNLQIRVAGVCDEPLARVIGITDAHKLIPKNTPGRFINNDGVIFHGYYIDDHLLPEILQEAREAGWKELMPPEEASS